MSTSTVPTIHVATGPPSAPPDGQRFLLEGLDWVSYEKLLEIVGDRHVFVTYDRGRAELMSPLWAHENRSYTIGKMVDAIASGLRAPIRGGGSTTFRRVDMDRGLEPDKCFYVANEPFIRSHTTIDLSVDPPPDLCVEVEMSSRQLDRIGIYAVLGVPELWRDDGRQLRTFSLSPDRVYVETSSSLAFPTLSSKRLNRYLDRARGLDETTWADKVRAAARRHRPGG